MDSIAFFLALAGTIIGVYALAPITHRLGLSDIPCERKQHDGHIPLIGGIAIYFSICITALLIFPFRGDLLIFFVATGLVVFSGAIDDRNDICFKTRLIIQIIAALIFTLGTGISLNTLGSIFSSTPVDLGMLSLPLTVIGIMALINAYNLIDGLDGLSGGLALTCLLSILMVTNSSVGSTIIGLLSLLIGALVAYLIFNLHLLPNHSPKIFLGDAGSTLLGFLVCAFLLRYSQTDTPVISPTTTLWFTAVPLMDMVATFWRRIKHGKSPFQPDRTHIHHIFQHAGFTNGQTLTIILLLAALFSGIGFIIERAGISDTVSFIGFVIAYILYNQLLSHAWRVSKFLKVQINQA